MLRVMQELIEAIALRLDVPQGTVGVWRHRRKVPPHWRLKIANIAREDHGVVLTDDDFVLRPKREPATGADGQVAA